MAQKKTYYPAKTFDDDLDGFAKLFKSKGWSFSNIDGQQLVTDAVTQREERAEHDALESKYFHVHETFGIAQEARYQHFSAALNAARGAFRNDKAIMAELDRYKRSATRRTTKEPEARAAPKPVKTAKTTRTTKAKKKEK